MLHLTKDMETGVEKIDLQHKELISRINSLLAIGEKSASAEETRKTFDYLGDYVAKHFRDEEEIHIKSGYPKREEHKKKHALFIEDFSKLENEFLEKGNSMQLTMKLNNSVVAWIIKHIKGDDVEFGKFYKEQAV
ncbi:MAG: bacteriohemerythrin [Treponema sp.]|jgi:hemerythrin|nr:bacteriohemerythrin [Treponema sp.]